MLTLTPEALLWKETTGIRLLCVESSQYVLNGEIIGCVVLNEHKFTFFWTYIQAVCLKKGNLLLYLLLTNKKLLKIISVVFMNDCSLMNFPFLSVPNNINSQTKGWYECLYSMSLIWYYALIIMFSAHIQNNIRFVASKNTMLWSLNLHWFLICRSFPYLSHRVSIQDAVSQKKRMKTSSVRPGYLFISTLRTKRKVKLMLLSEPMLL